MGDIAIIATSSRSRSDFEKDHEDEIFRDLEILTWTQPGPDLDPLDLDPSLSIIPILPILLDLFRGKKGVQKYRTRDKTETRRNKP